MEDRYQRVFILPKDQVAESCPVVLSAGALTKDTQTERLFAQLRTRNLSQKTIKGAKVCLQLQNMIGESFGTPIEYDYLDLSISRGEEFGSKTPIWLSALSVRAFYVQSITLYYTDNTACYCNVPSWTAFPKQKTLDSVLNKAQCWAYHQRFRDSVGLLPDRHSSFWRCSCGMINADGLKCSKCSCSYEEVSDIDPDALTVAAAKQPINNKDYQAALSMLKPLADRPDAQELIAYCEEKEAECQAQKEATRLERNRRAEEAIMVAKRRKRIIKIVAIITIPIIVIIIGLSVILAVQFNIPHEKDVQIQQMNTYKKTLRINDTYAVYVDSEGKVITDGHGSEGFIPNTSSWGIITQACPIGNGLIAVDSNGNLHLAQYPEQNINVNMHSDYCDFVDAGGIILGLTSSGTVELIYDTFGEANNIVPKIPNKKITKICGDGAANTHFIVYLLPDGKAEMIYSTDSKDIKGQYNKMATDISSWDDIIDLSASYTHVLGLKRDGTVVATGKNNNGQCSVDQWENIIMVSAGDGHSVALDADGNVFSCGADYWGQTNTNSWKNIVYICAGGWNTLAVDNTGKIYCTGEMNLKNIVCSY